LRPRILRGGVENERRGEEPTKEKTTHDAYASYGG